MTEKFLLPKGWRWVKLGEMCEICQYGLTASASNIPNGFPFIRISDIDDFGSIKIDNMKFVACKEDIYNKYALKEGDILFARSGSIGRTFLYSGNPPNAIFASYLIRFRIKKAIIDPSYLFYYTHSPEYSNFIDEKKHTLSQPNINAQEYKSLLIPLPPIEEQRRIIAKLQELMQQIDRARSACEKQLEAAKALPSAYLREVFESEEAKKWERKRLGEVCEICQYGLTATATNIPKGFPIIRISDIDDFGSIKIDNMKFVACEEDIYNKYALKEGDILFARSGSIGRTFLYNGNPPNAIFASYLIRFRIKKEIIDPFYLFYYTHSPEYYNFIDEKKHTLSQPNINAHEYKSLLIPLPPTDVQRRIASYLKEKMAYIQNLQSAIQKQQSAINALPQAILRKAFRGEL